MDLWYYNALLLFSRQVVSNPFATPWTGSTRLLSPWDYPGKNTGAGCYFLLEGIFPTQGFNPHHLHWQVDSLPLSHLGSPSNQGSPYNACCCGTSVVSDSVWVRSPPGSPVPGMLQARILEWVAISFSNAWKGKVKGKSLSRVRLVATPWTAAYQAAPSTGFSRRVLEWGAIAYNA